MADKVKGENDKFKESKRAAEFLIIKYCTK